MMFGSVCSGIEAATVAWHQLGWKAAWFAEIESAPSIVLKHHYPHIPNLGDMTKLQYYEEYTSTAIDLLVGGTPCQSFSIAGLRGGLDDKRGNLALEFCRILLDKQPKWFVWENVPGVFSSFSSEADSKDVSGDSIGDGRENRADNTEEVVETSDFAAIIAAFQECGYSVAWRVFDSQYFGVPQRRRRVFVVGHLGNDWRPPVAVLFERDSLRRDFTPGRETRKETTTATGCGTAGESGSAIVNIPYAETCGTLQARDYKGVGNQYVSENKLVIGQIIQPSFCIQGNVADRASTQNGSGVGREYAFTMNRTDRHVVAAPMMLKMREGCAGGGKGPLLSEEKAFTLSTRQDQTLIQPVVYDTTNITSPTNGSNPHPNGLVHTLAKGQHAPLLCLPINTMNVQGRPSDNSRMGSGIGKDGEPQNTLSKAHSHAVFYGPVAFTQNQSGDVLTGDVMHSLATNANSSGRNAPNVLIPSQYIVRRLTPLECERLQGFPDNYTNVPGMSDSSRYACIGNSMTVNVMRWIGKRIDTVDKLLTIIKK